MNINPKDKMINGELMEKWILRKAFEDLLPKSVACPSLSSSSFFNKSIIFFKCINYVSKLTFIFYKFVFYCSLIVFF